MRKHVYAQALLLGLSCFSAAAQSYSLEGYIHDEEGAALEAAYVYLLRPSDSLVLASTLSDTAGHYQLEGLAADRYILRVKAPAYLPQYRELLLLASGREDFVLQRNTRELGEVVVKGEKPSIEEGMGMLQLNLNERNTATMNSAWDVLRQSPGVLVDQDANVLLNGSIASVLVEGKSTYLSGKDLEAYLKSLPAAQLAQVQLIAQPSARYDKEGSGGIINLKLQASKERGCSGLYNVSLSLAKEVHPATRSNLNLQYNRDKWQLFAHGAYVHVQGFLDEKLQRRIADTSGSAYTRQEQSAYYKETWEDYSLDLGGVYRIAEGSSWGTKLKTIYHPNKEKDVMSLQATDAGGVATSSAMERTYRLYKNGLIGNAYLQWTGHKGHSLRTDFDYVFRDYSKDMGYTALSYDAQGQPNGDDLALRASAPFLTHIYALRSDYAYALPKETQLEAGIKGSWVDMDMDNRFEIQEQGLWQYDSSRSNHFKYTERIYAAYGDIHKAWHKHWTAQLGLRIEHTELSGSQTAGGTAFLRSFSSWFPTAYLAYQPNEQHRFELNYGKRIERPAYTMLNPFVQYTSLHQYQRGNPYLLPAYSHVLELKYSYKHRLFTSLELVQRSNMVNQVFVHEGGEVVSTYANNAIKKIVHASCNVHQALRPWWSCSASVELYYQNYRLMDQVDTYADALACYFSLQNEFSFPHAYALSTAYHWLPANLQGMIERSAPRQSMSMALSKKLLQDTASVRIAVEDPFNIYRYNYENAWNGVQTSGSNRYLTQQLTLGFSYNIGRQKELADSRREHSLEEAKRM